MTVPSYQMLAPHYAKLWADLVPLSRHLSELTKICNGLLAHKATYESVSQTVWGKPDYWWYVAVTDQMEGGGGAHTYLGNGQSLDRVTTEVPAGRGPFANFHDGAIDALHGVGAPISVSRAAYDWEGFNGWGYLSKDIEDPYLASFSDKYTAGKYTSDHHYDPNAVSEQPGALTILKVLVGIEPTIQLGGDVPPPIPVPPTPIPTIPPAMDAVAIRAALAAIAPYVMLTLQVRDSPMGPHDPLPPQKLKPSPTSTTQSTEGHDMVDITQIEKDADMALAVAEKAIPFVSMFNPALGSILSKIVAGARAIEKQFGVSPAAALQQVESHNTPGAPNSPVLNG